MTTSRTCPQCGVLLPPGAADWLCPKCLLGQAAAPKPTGSPPTPHSPLATPHSTPVRHYFGDYELLHEIARGGMGVVYKARQVSLNRIVAVKVLLGGEFSSPEFVRRFRQEAKAAATLQHPHIVAIHEVGEFEGRQYFSMDYVEGGHLGDLIRPTGAAAAPDPQTKDNPPAKLMFPLPDEAGTENLAWHRRAAHLVKAVAIAVHYAHERGVIHRDLKPSNILLTADGQPRVTDFGVAKILAARGSASHRSTAAMRPAGMPPPAESMPVPPHPEHKSNPSELTLTGQILGTPNYMSPEQAGGQRGAATAVSDVYSLGAVLYFLVTGRAPFVANTIAETLHRVVHAEPVSPRLLNPSVPVELATICLKCLEKEPAKRYLTALQLADDLDRYLQGEPVLAATAAWTDFNGTLWATPEYRGFYLGRADEIIPARQYQFYICRSFLDFFAPAGALQICDLGCGDGSLAEQLFAWRPNTKLTLVDGAAAMLETAARRLGARRKASFVHATFDGIIQGQPLPGPFDAIVSSWAIHHLNPAERNALFIRVMENLRPAGWFLNIDVALPDETAFTEWQFELWRQWLMEIDKSRLPSASLRHIPDEARQNPDNKYSTLASQLSGLRAAGFSDVDCLYRNGVFTIYCGRRPLPRSLVESAPS